MKVTMRATVAVHVLGDASEMTQRWGPRERSVGWSSGGGTGHGYQTSKISKISATETADMTKLPRTTSGR